MFASSFEMWDQRLLWSREFMPVLSLERHMLDARSKTLAWLLFSSNLALGGSVGRGNYSFLIQSSLHLDGRGYRTFDGEHGGLLPRALPTHGCTRTRATASQARLRSLSAESRLDASMGCDSQVVIQLIVVVPVLVRWHACSGQFLSVLRWYPNSACTWREDVQLPATAEMIEQVRVPSIAEWLWGTLHTAVDAFAGVLPTLSTHFDANLFKNARDPVTITRCKSALQASAWAWQFQFVLWFTTWFCGIQRWGRGCACHPDETECQ